MGPLLEPHFTSKIEVSKGGSSKIPINNRTEKWVCIQPWINRLWERADQCSPFSAIFLAKNPKCWEQCEIRRAECDVNGMASDLLKNSWMLDKTHKLIQGHQTDLFYLRWLCAFLIASLMINSAFINNESHNKTYKPSNLKDWLPTKRTSQSTDTKSIRVFLMFGSARKRQTSQSLLKIVCAMLLTLKKNLCVLTVWNHNMIRAC